MAAEGTRQPPLSFAKVVSGGGDLQTEKDFPSIVAVEIQKSHGVESAIGSPPPSTDAQKIPSPDRSATNSSAQESRKERMSVSSSTDGQTTVGGDQNMEPAVETESPSTDVEKTENSEREAEATQIIYEPAPVPKINAWFKKPSSGWFLRGKGRSVKMVCSDVEGTFELGRGWGQIGPQPPVPKICFSKSGVWH